MRPAAILLGVAVYFILLLSIAWWTARNATETSYTLGDRQSPWWLLALGTVGDALSGVTFISVPGEVAQRQFAYLQVVFGYVFGYLLIARGLLPIYYRLQLTSIYSYLGGRLGGSAQRTGAVCFIASRLAGAGARLYLAVTVFQHFVFQPLGIPFAVTAGVVILLMLAYTIRGGIKTLVWTDLLQSTFLLGALVLSVVALQRHLGLSMPALVMDVIKSPLSQTFFFQDWKAPNYFWKQFLSGIGIALVMTGLDQNMMQKNLSCRTLREAQKSIIGFVPILVAVNVVFLGLGALLFQYAGATGIALPSRSDLVFPTLALQHLGWMAAGAFLLGLTAATFNSADSVLTTLTTAFGYDVLGWRDSDLRRDDRRRLRSMIHGIFAALLFFVLLLFQWLNDGAVISTVLKIAGFTYGPLLGLFAVGILTRWKVRERFIPWICAACPILCWVLDRNAKAWLGGYQFGFELLLLNGALTIIGLRLIRCRVA